MLFIGVLFVLSPGILITSLLATFIDFTTSQLWGAAIVASIAVIIGVAILLGGNDVIKGYLITALCCSLFMFIIYLFIPDNCFYNTICRMMNTESSKKTSQSEVASDSKAYSPASSSANKDVIYEKSNEATEETDFVDDVDESQSDYSSNETAMNEETSISDGNSIDDVKEVMPEFPGGPQALMDYLKSNVIFPKVAEDDGIQGRVVVSYVVDIDGSITDVQVVQSVHPALDKEAMRVVRNMPKWIPGKHDGKAVQVKYSLPINFYYQ
jgi:TonB family protein